MKRHIFLLIFCICFFSFVGCRTQKATLTQDISTVREVETERVADVSKMVAVEVEEERIEERTIVEYSEPDTATGKQYVVRVVMEGAKAQRRKNTEVKTQENIIEQVVSELQMRQNTNIKEQTKTRTPSWVYMIGSIVFGGILIVIYIIIQKLKKR